MFLFAAPIPLFLRKSKIKNHKQQINNKQRSLRVESETLVEFKELFKAFFDNYLTVENLRTQDEEKREMLSDSFVTLQNRLLDNSAKLEQLSTLIDGYLVAVTKISKII